MTEEEIINLIATEARYNEGFYYIFFGGRVIKANTPMQLREIIEKEIAEEQEQQSHNNNPDPLR